MENNVKTLSKILEDGGFTITKQVTERLSEQDLLSRRQQLAYRQSDTRRQAKQIEGYLDAIAAEIEECDGMLRELQETGVQV